jgi:hypothetical protein
MILNTNVARRTAERRSPGGATAIAFGEERLGGATKDAATAPTVARRFRHFRELGQYPDDAGISLPHRRSHDELDAGLGDSPIRVPGADQRISLLHLPGFILVRNGAGDGSRQTRLTERWVMREYVGVLMPAKAGIHCLRRESWIPAFAATTAGFSDSARFITRRMALTGSRWVLLEGMLNEIGLFLNLWEGHR